MHWIQRLVSTLSFVAAAVAQTPSIPTAAFGVAEDSGVLRASGPAYSATFDAGGCDFTPLLGELAPRSYPLRCTLAAAYRGDAVLYARTSLPALPQLEGTTVRYQHTRDLVERYTAGTDGIEQSFVFASRPAGAGDLVVELDVETDLGLDDAGPDRLAYSVPGLGGVTFGGVTGIDANGDRVAGTIRASTRRIELRLPAAFVDRAAYPLVLDPLIGSNIVAGTSPTGSDLLSAVAYDATTDKYLVVWSAAVTSFLAEIRAHLVAGDGSLTGGLMTLTTTATRGERPGVGGVNVSNRFAVAWCSQVSGTPFSTGRVNVRLVQASNGLLSNVLSRSFTTGVTSSVSVGGDRRLGTGGAHEQALVVFRETPSFTSGNTLHMWLVDVPVSGQPTTANTALLTSTTTLLTEPSVTKHQGDQGRWLVAYARGPAIGGNADEIRARLVDSTGAICGTTAGVGTATSTSVGLPSVGTQDGGRFLVAWEDRGLSVDVRTRRIDWTGTCGAGSWSFGTMTTPWAGSSSQPAVEFAGSHYLLALRGSLSTFPMQNCQLMTLTATQGFVTGWRTSLEVTGINAPNNPVIAARSSGSTAIDDEALVVWSSGANIRAQRAESRGQGTVTSMGGACGIPGLSDVASYSGRPVIGTTFTIELIAPTSPVLALVVGFTPAPQVCGACTLVPSIDIVLPGVSPAAVAIPEGPALANVSLYAQWIQYRPSGCPTFPDIGCSNCLRFGITW